MRFTTIATVLVASACAAFALPTELDTADAALLERRRDGFEVWAWPTTSFSGVEYKTFSTTGSHALGFDARSWQYYDFGCCIRSVV
jgi:hypothetical protein